MACCATPRTLRGCAAAGPAAVRTMSSMPLVSRACMESLPAMSGLELYSGVVAATGDVAQGTLEGIGRARFLKEGGTELA